MKIRLLGAGDVRRALPMRAAIEGMKLAFAQLSAGNTQTPQRTQLPIAEHDGVAIFMPAYLAGSSALAVKIVSVFPGNVARGMPSIHGLVLALDAQSGQPLAIIEGGALTAIRTGAASGAATDILARQDASSVAIIGSGVQARTQLEAVCTVRPIGDARVFSRNRQNAETFAAEMAGHGPIPQNITVARSADEAVRGADIVCTATSSSTPVFSGSALAHGAHVNAVGSFRTDMQEVDVETVAQSLIVVDSREAVKEEAGDLMIPIAQGMFSFDHIHAELGEIINGTKPGRPDATTITTFKSVGVAVQDAVAAQIALQRAQELGLGVEIDF